MNENRKKWRICSEYFTNCEYIYPTQQHKVKQLIDHIKEKPEVKSIIIFGSSITHRCTNDSDVDIYVELDKERKVINKYFDFVFDLWTNFTVDDNLLNEINKKGLVVYER